MCGESGTSHCLWFWTTDVWQDSDVGEWMEDCTCFSVHLYLIYVTFNSVYQVHWLWAKAQKMRWVEELQCLQVEMESAVRFFKYQGQIWHAREEVIDFQLQRGTLHGQPDKVQCGVHWQHRQSQSFPPCSSITHRLNVLKFYSHNKYITLSVHST